MRVLAGIILSKQTAEYGQQTAEIIKKTDFSSYFS